MNTKRLNIAMRPSQELENYIFDTVKKLGMYGEMLFTLDGISYFPHATIYSPEFPADAEERVIGVLEQFCKKQPVVQSTFTSLDVEDGYIVADFIVNDAIVNLHKHIVSILNPIRNGALRAKYLDESYMSTLPETKRNNILMYGYPGVMDEYKPHFTLTRYEEASIADEVIKTFEWGYTKVEVSRIGLFEMGENGTCIKLVKEFTLSLP